MTEDEAKSWIRERYGDDAVASLIQFVRLVEEEMPVQNLISASSLQTIWVRHIVDSAQLVPLATQTGRWIDIGTGAGFPGVVTALLSGRETLLVEPRRRRADFLQRAINKLGLDPRVMVRQAKIGDLIEHASVISARAVSSVDALLRNGSLCADRHTQWLLPKGRNAREEVAQAKKSWQGVFHVEQSITDPDSMIVIASGISRR